MPGNAEKLTKLNTKMSSWTGGLFERFFNKNY